MVENKGMDGFFKTFLLDWLIRRKQNLISYSISVLIKDKLFIPEFVPLIGGDYKGTEFGGYLNFEMVEPNKNSESSETLKPLNQWGEI